MKTALLFDIDGTLTVPRQALEKEMADALKAINVPWHVAAGSNLDLVVPQFLQPLWDFGCRRDFEAFVSNGSAHYRCPFSEKFSIDEVLIFDFEKHVGAENFQRLVNELTSVLNDPNFALPDTVSVIGDQLKNRGSMVNCTPIGRPDKANLDEAALNNRSAFAAFDKATNYRRRVIEHLNQRLADLIREKDLRIMLGGETSFDLVVAGQDKTNAVTTLTQEGVESIVFFGDALFPGGNDSVITDFIADWKSDSPCPVKAIQVDGWENTVLELRKNGWLEG
jgi:phosphomannomutase